MKRILLTIGTASASIAPLATVVACGTVKTTIVDNRVMERVRSLLGKNMLPVTGTDDWKNIQTYITNELKTIGLSPEIHQFEYSTNPDDHNHVAGNQVDAIKYNKYWQEEVDKKRDFGSQQWDYENDKFREDVSYATGLIGRNIVVEIEGTDATKKNKIVTIGAHYDLFKTYAETGSDGFQDNNVGVAALLELVKELKSKPQEHTLRFVFFDVEEFGLEGSWQYAQIAANTSIAANLNYKKLNDDGTLEATNVNYGPKEDQTLYINLDSFAGGDNVVFGRGLGQTTGANSVLNEYELMSHIARQELDAVFQLPYYMEWSSSAYWTDYALEEMYNPNGTFNEHLSTHVYDHPTETALGIGEHQQGDHRYLVNAGIKSLFFESTNYQLAGEYGRDGYSQTDHADFWAPDPNLVADGTITKSQVDIGIIGGPYGLKGVNDGGYPRKHEYIWGKIWHNNKGLDKLSYLEQKFGDRLQKQTDEVFQTVLSFLQRYKAI